MDQIIKVRWDLNENSDNRYKLVYEIAELAKKSLMKIKQEKQEKILVLMKPMKQLTLKENPVGDAFDGKSIRS